MILIEFLVKFLLITNMITLPTVWVSIKCLHINTLSYMLYERPNLCYMNGPIYYMKGQIYDIY